MIIFSRTQKKIFFGNKVYYSFIKMYKRCCNQCQKQVSLKSLILSLRSDLRSYLIMPCFPRRPSTSLHRTKPNYVRNWKQSYFYAACEEHYFGHNCTSPCHCLSNGNCSPVNGSCNSGKCDIGWLGQNCSNGKLLLFL